MPRPGTRNGEERSASSTARRSGARLIHRSVHLPGERTRRAGPDPYRTEADSMTLFGYACVRTDGQTLDAQVAQLETAPWR